jgi:CheY-like chemotaxis protein
MSKINETNSIMIVEDSADDFEAISRAFKINSIINPVNHFVNGEDAINYLFANDTKDKLPALILLDLNMPKTDGRVFLKIIKNDERFINIPIIVLTTSLNDNDIEKCYENGANSYLQKPVRFEELVESIKQLKEFWFNDGKMPIVL